MIEMRHAMVFSWWVILSAMPAAGADWPCFRGPRHNGVAAESAPSAKAVSQNSGPLWKANVGKGYSGVSVADERVYTLGNSSSDETDGIDTIFCLDVLSGQEYWRLSYSCRPGNVHYPGPKSTPAIDDSRLYSVSDAGVVFCLDRETGAILWTVDVPKAYGAVPSHFGVSTSPLIHKDWLILNFGRSGLVLDKRNGETIWANAKGACSFSSPVVFSCRGRDLIAMFAAKTFYLLDLDRGQELASVPWLTTADENSADPIVVKDAVFISSAYGLGSAVFQVTDEQLSLVWKNKHLNNVFSSSVVLNGFIFGFDGGVNKRAKLKCIDFKTGTVQWQEMLGFGSLIAADDQLIVLLADGTLVLVRAQSSGYECLARTRVSKRSPSQRSDRQVHWWTAPTLSNGRLFLRNNQGDLICLDLRSSRGEP